MKFKSSLIAFCTDCHYHDFSDDTGEIECRHTIDNGIKGNADYSIPDWCPLPDYEEWIPVTTRLPMEGVGEGVIGEFLVTVEVKGSALNYEPEAALLYFCSTTKTFSVTPGGTPYGEDNNWHVTHWRQIPMLAFKPVRIS